jgi:hypothetical protein
MESRLIFLHHCRRSKGPGRFLESDRAIRSARAPLLVKGAEGIYDPEVVGKRAKKSRPLTKVVPVLKPTQVGEMSILRRSRERS